MRERVWAFLDQRDLRRCVLEVHAIAKKQDGGTFAVAMTEHEKNRFLRGIWKDPGLYYRMLGTINLEDSVCSRPADRLCIHAGIRNSVGFRELGRMVFGVMEKWIVQEIERQCLAEQNEGNDLVAMQWTNKLACVLRDQGRLDEALVLGERALETARRFFDEKNRRLGFYMCNLAITYKALQLFEKALALEESALELYKRVLASDEERMHSALSRACLLSDHGFEEKGFRVEERAREFERQVLPRNYRDIGKTTSKLAVTYCKLGRLDDALEMHQRAFNFREKNLPSFHPDVGESMNNLGSAYSDLCQHSDALAMKTKALDFRQKHLPANHPHIAISMNNLAATYSHLSRHDDALKMQECALEIQQRVLPHFHPDIRETMSNLAVTYSHLRRHDDALAMQAKILEFQRRDSSGSRSAGSTSDVSCAESSAEPLTIQLGDIIRITAPTHQEMHEHMFYVEYASPHKLKLIDTDTLEKRDLLLPIKQAITCIELLSRAEEEGFARQNNLLVSTWVDLQFGGDIPATITGMITNLEGDMIEIRTFPQDEIVYIDFGYMGIPEYLPLEKITIRSPPESYARDKA